MKPLISPLSLPRLAPACGILLLCAYFSGCASFDPRWRAANGTANSHLATRWDGRWTSAKHHTQSGAPEGGRLRCVLERHAGNQLNAYFHANFLCFSANYSVKLAPKPGGPMWAYQGTQELPAIFGGTYRYSATIRKDHFSAHYASSYDNGNFDLHRVEN